MRPLAELDRVPWDSLTHAYGAAADVPGLMRRLASAGDAENVADAEHKLWAAVLHQGNVYSATAPLLPFVFGLLRDRPDLRPTLVDWPTDVCWVFDHEADSGPIADTRAALAAGVDAVLDLLADSRIEVRAAVTGFLGKCTPRARQCWDALRARLPLESASGVQADLMISMTRLARAAGRAGETGDLLDEWSRSDDPARNCVAAHERCLLDPSDPRPWPTLINFLPSGQPVSSWWGGGTPTRIVAALAQTTGALHTPAALDAALACLDVPNHYVATQVLRPILANVFPGGHHDVPTYAADLTPRQRQVIDFLASGRVSFVEKKLHKTTQEPMNAYLLPNDVPTLRKWLAGARQVDCVAPGLRDRLNPR